MTEQTKVSVPDEKDVWVPADVIGSDGSVVKVKAIRPSEDSPLGGDELTEDTVEALEINLEEHGYSDASELPLQNSGAAEDMCTLDYLHEPGVLYNLRERYFEKKPYTYTGSMCIAVNPYDWLAHLYTDDLRESYLITENRSDLSPHIYAISATAYKGVSKINFSGKWIGTDQSILVSGESGAGKTESVKIMMKHLASVASSEDDSTNGDGNSQDVVRRVLESQPLLESFGNAKTVRNDNSSRFGKFTQLEFADDAAEKGRLRRSIALVGSRCRTYLLEKSRVVQQAPGERTYHCFYGVKRQNSLPTKLPNLQELRYVKDGDLETFVIEGQKDGDRHERTWDALKLVGVSDDDRNSLVRILAAVLLMGELEFMQTETDVADSPAKLDQSNELCQNKAAVAVEALGAESIEALQNALTERTMRARNEVFKVPLDVTKATDARDALAKEIYLKAFDWVVANINYSTSSNLPDAKVKVVGLLDIFGFESFTINRFEQLCINYTNEKLQQKFTIDLFKTVQQEYDDEQIPWQHISFPDNAAVLALIDGRMGIIDVLNEECVRPRGSDEGFVSKLTTLHGATSANDTPRFTADRIRKNMFTILHYAGPVTYTAIKWLERNNDTLPEDLFRVAKGSKFKLLAQLFIDKSVTAAANHAAPSTKKASRRSTSSIAADTVSTKFKAQLSQLMDEVEKTQVQYVRCVKPNTQKSKSLYDAKMVTEQLRCAGVIEAIRVSRAGYPNKLAHGEFTRRFAALNKENTPPAKDKDTACRNLATTLIGPQGIEAGYAVGLTRIYFKAGVLEALERQRALALSAKAIKIQATFRRHRLSRCYKITQRGILKLAAQARRRSKRSAYVKILVAVYIAQSARRAVLATRAVLTLRRAHRATRITAQFRRFQTRKLYLMQRAASTKIQARQRCRAAVAAYIIALAEAKEQAKLENQLEAMQAKLKAMEEANRALSEKTNAAPTEKEIIIKEVASSDESSALASARAEAEAERKRADETSAEMMRLLQQLRADNDKLRKEAAGLRDENHTLKRRVAELEAGQSMRLDWLAAARQSLAGGGAQTPSSKDRSGSTISSSAHTMTPPRKDTHENDPETTPGAETVDNARKHVSRFSALVSSLGFGAGNSRNTSNQTENGRRKSGIDTPVVVAHPNNQGITSAPASSGGGPHIALPQNRFWQDIPAMNLAGALQNEIVIVHLKVGGQYLCATGTPIALDTPGGNAEKDDQRYLRCEKPATGDSPDTFGYRAAMSFRVEVVSRQNTEDEAQTPEDKLSSIHFRLKSELTGGYCTVGGLFQRYCLVASAPTPEEAATFQFVPRRVKPLTQQEDVMPPIDDSATPTNGAASMERLRAKQLLVALRVVDGPKASHYVRVRPDAYVNVAPPASAAAAKGALSHDDGTTPLLSIELLVPLQSYEITFHSSQLGLIVSKTMPLRVVRFKELPGGAAAATPGSTYASAAELTGRISIGDILATANNNDILNCSRREAVDIITSTRPITIGFKVGYCNTDLLANYQSPKPVDPPLDLLTP
uniref:Myosin motor domain-containing protein n=1 Tax=Aureoumbra lagunensis TaxID=44058 RepID=A0A7S3NK29_9STRA